MYVVVQLKPKATNITISEVKKPVVIPKSALKQLEATISSISMIGKVTVRFSKQL
jgi:hypothetical protein